MIAELSELQENVDYSGALAEIHLVMVEMGLSVRSEAFKQMLGVFGCDSLSMLESCRLESFLGRLQRQRDRQPREVLSKIHQATILAARIYPQRLQSNPWSAPSLTKWRDSKRPLTEGDLDKLIGLLSSALARKVA